MRAQHSALAPRNCGATRMFAAHGFAEPSPQPLSRRERGFFFSFREKKLPLRRQRWREAPEEGSAERGYGSFR